MGRSTRRRPRPTGLPRCFFEGSAGWPPGTGLCKRSSGILEHRSRSPGPRVASMTWLVVFAMLAIGGGLAFSPFIEPTVGAFSSDAPEPIFARKMFGAPVMSTHCGNQDGACSLRFSQPSNSLGDGPNTTLTNWLTKLPPAIVLVDAGSQPPAANDNATHTAGTSRISALQPA